MERTSPEVKRRLVPVLLLLLAAAASAAPADPNLWLEDILGEKAISWVKARNAQSEGELGGDARFEPLRQDLRRIYNASDRIPRPNWQGGWVYNFWQDAQHVRGLWRRTSLAEYRKKDPAWQVLLDYTAQWTPSAVEEIRLEGRACYLLVLRPPDGGAGQLKVWLERRRWLPLKVEERDESDNLVTYTLRDHQLGPVLKPSLFRFVAPQGVEVIDRRGDGQR